jgi:hypothetical protein
MGSAAQAAFAQPALPVGRSCPFQGMAAATSLGIRGTWQRGDLARYKRRKLFENKKLCGESEFATLAKLRGELAPALVAAGETSNPAIARRRHFRCGAGSGETDQ